MHGATMAHRCVLYVCTPRLCAQRLREEVAALRLRANAGPVPGPVRTHHAVPTPTPALPSPTALDNRAADDGDVAAAAQASFLLLMQQQGQQQQQQLQQGGRVPVALKPEPGLHGQYGSVGLGGDTHMVTTPTSFTTRAAVVASPGAVAAPVAGTGAGAGAGGVDMAAAAVVAAGIDPEDGDNVAEDALLELETDVTMFDQVFS